MVKAVTNATVIILLAKVQSLSLLDIFQEIITTEEVRKEIIAGKDIPECEKVILEDYFSKKIKINGVIKLRSLGLDNGETSALSLALEKKCIFFLSDDKKARRVAESLSLKPIGTLGIILKNVEKKNLTKEQARDLINRLVEHTYYLSTDVYKSVLDLL